MAIGLLMIGNGCSHLIFGTLTRFLITVYGWRGALLLNAGLFLQCLPLSFVFKPPNVKQNPAHIKDSKTKLETGDDCQKANTRRRSIKKKFFSYLHLMHNVRFDVYTVATVTTAVGVSTLFNHTANRAVQSGIDKTRASLLVTIMGGASLFGRLFVSIAANSRRVSTVLCYGLSALFGGVVTAAMYLADSFAGLTLGAVLGGVFFGKFRQ